MRPTPTIVMKTHFVKTAMGVLLVLAKAATTEMVYHVQVKYCREDKPTPFAMFFSALNFKSMNLAFVEVVMRLSACTKSFVKNACRIDTDGLHHLLSSIEVRPSLKRLSHLSTNARLNVVLTFKVVTISNVLPLYPYPA